MEYNKLPKPGQRVELIRMTDDYAVPSGTRGTVLRIDQWGASNDAYNVSVAWDNGRTLALLTDIDDWKVLSNETN